MLIKTAKGLYCPAGNFYIDPCAKVEHAVITHAHADHARRGNKTYYCASPGVALLRARLGHHIQVQTIDYYQKFNFKDVLVSFYPAGHILGSSQVKVEFCGQVWVVSGDYKRDPDPTCASFEPVPCDVFITEATFGTPAYQWEKSVDFAEEIVNWWQSNSKKGLNSVILAYSLGKAQRILGYLHNKTPEIIICHPSIELINACYREQGVELAATCSTDEFNHENLPSGKLFLLPPSFSKSTYESILGRYKIAFASGWMARTSYRYDQGFAISDHADWNDLIQTVLQSQAKRVYVQHRSGALIKALKARGLQAFSDNALIPKDENQLAFF